MTDQGLTITNVHLADGRGPVTLAVADGRIASIEPMGQGATPGAGDRTIDGESGVVLPGVVDAHCHLDQSLMLAPWTPLPPTETFPEKIKAAQTVFLSTTNPPLVERVEAVARSMLAQGTTTARSHASITVDVGLAGVEALLETKRRLAGAMRIQVVAFPQFGTRDARIPKLMDEAMRMGCDVVGGMDPGDVDHDIEGSLRRTFEMAERHAAPIDIHMHDPGHLGLYEIERLCDLTEATGMQGKVVISHALCLGELDAPAVAATLDRIAASGAAVVSAANPNAAMPRVLEVIEHGVSMGLGSDSAHTSAPFGTSDMFKKANVLAQRHTFVTDIALRDTFERISSLNSVIVGVPFQPIEVGAPADLLVVSARSAAEAVASPPRKRIVVVGGKVLSNSYAC